MPKTPDPPAPDQAMLDSIGMIDRAVDAVHITANAIARTIAMDAPDVPRMCVTAGLRTVEKMVEHYSRRLELEATGITPFDMREKVKLQQIMLAQCNDFLDVCGEACQMVTRIRDGIHKTGNSDPGTKPN